MAGVKISALPAIVAPATNDFFPVVNAGVTYKETVSQLSSLLASTIHLTAANIFGLTNGQLLIGNTGNPATASTLSAGTNISINNAAGSITINSSGLAGFNYTVVTANVMGLVANNGYITNSTDTLVVAYTLPAVIAVGTVIEIIGQSNGGWTLAQNAGQTVHIDNVSTTVGVGGSLATTARYESIKLVCTVANNEFVASSVVGNLTIV